VGGKLHVAISTGNAHCKVSLENYEHHKSKSTNMAFAGI
jgi:hypothetical protein